MTAPSQDAKLIAREPTVKGRDIWEVANQLQGYASEATPDFLAKWLLREADAAADLAYEIKRLLSENERLRKALEPFVFGDGDIADILWGDLPDDRPMNMTLKLGAYRAARAALEQTDAKGKAT